jgi:demethylmenaquinone methyltransferase/2-methoxy-6-polyprenyl-1,4-benzoquinol methylase
MSEEFEYYTLTKKAFDILAPFYNIMALPLVKVRDQVVDFSGAGKNSTILDVATGTGQQAFAFAKHGYYVTGVDLTESMLAVARKNNKNGLVKFEIGDATHLRFEDNSFDVACISFALHDMPLTIREKVLKEMVRVTKPCGSIVIVDYSLPRNGLGRFLIYRLITLYEGEYYNKFIGSDLEGLTQSLGIEIVEECSILVGAGRILRGKKTQ